MSPRALVCLAMFVLAACVEQHDPATQSIAKDYCYGCHAGEYNATGVSAPYAAAPVHSTSQCSTQCALCHTTTTWVNQLGGCVHPEAAFPLASQGTQHTNIPCTSCHSEAISIATGATSVKGANTDCISCHPNTSQQQQNHVGVTYDNGTLVGQPYAYSNTDHRFCLDCHPNGLAAGHGPSNPFRLPHRGSTCAQCHDSASGLGHAGGADVRCSVQGGCHSTIDADGSEHSNPDRGHHPACLNCHLSGGGGGG